MSTSTLSREPAAAGSCPTREVPIRFKQAGHPPIRAKAMVNGAPVSVAALLQLGNIPVNEGTQVRIGGFGLGPNDDARPAILSKLTAMGSGGSEASSGGVALAAPPANDSVSSIAIEEVEVLVAQDIVAG